MTMLGKVIVILDQREELDNLEWMFMGQAHKEARGTLRLRMDATTQNYWAQEYFRWRNVEPWFAFDGHSGARRKWLATTYADEWIQDVGRGWVRSWHICLHGCGWVSESGDRPRMNTRCCGSLTSSKLWHLMNEGDPLAADQRWYCWQNHRYNASWGQVVEFMTVEGSLMYAWADVPTGDMLDVRAAKIEQEVSPDATAKDIYKSLQIFSPQTSHEHIFVHPVAPQAAEGQVQRWYGVDINFYNQLPYFAWEEIVNMTGAPLTEIETTRRTWS